MRSERAERYFAMFRRPEHALSQPRRRASLMGRIRRRLGRLTANDLAIVVEELLTAARVELENLSRRAERLKGILADLNERVGLLEKERADLCALMESTPSTSLLILLRIRMSEVEAELARYELLKLVVEDQLADVEYRMEVVRSAVERMEELKKSGNFKKLSRLLSLLSPITWVLKLFLPSLRPVALLPLVAGA